MQWVRLPVFPHMKARIERASQPTDERDRPELKYPQ